MDDYLNVSKHVILSAYEVPGTKKFYLASLPIWRLNANWRLSCKGTAHHSLARYRPAECSSSVDDRGMSYPKDASDANQGSAVEHRPEGAIKADAMDVDVGPADKEARSTPVVVQPWPDVARIACTALSTQDADRSEFHTDEIVQYIEANWDACCGSRERTDDWKQEFCDALENKQVLAKVSQKSGYWALKNGAAQSRSKKRKLPENGAQNGDAQQSKHGPSADSKSTDALTRTPQDNAAPGKRRIARRSVQEPGSGERAPFKTVDGKHPQTEDPALKLTVPDAWANIPDGPVLLSDKDKAQGIAFEGERKENTVRGYKGYRTIRATHGAVSGSWYFEVTVLPYKGDGAVRLGWSTRRADIETPVGFDSQGFGIRDRTGEFIHKARLKPYGEAFNINDTVGCHIYLPQLTNAQRERVAAADQRWLEYRFLNASQGKRPDDAGFNVDKAYVQFSKNGKCLGTPRYFFKSQESKDRGTPDVGMRAGKYYPSISLYGTALVTVNFGPTFQYERPKGSRPFADIAPPPPAAPSPTPTAQPGAPSEQPKPSQAPDGAASVGRESNAERTANNDPKAQSESLPTSTA